MIFPLYCGAVYMSAEKMTTFHGAPSSTLLLDKQIDQTIINNKYDSFFSTYYMPGIVLMLYMYLYTFNYFEGHIRLVTLLFLHHGQWVGNWSTNKLV